MDAVPKQELLENVRSSGRAFVEAARAIPPERWPEGRYEEGWTAKDILAHVASIEWTYPKLLDVARGVPAQRRTNVAEKPSADLPGDYNQRHVAKRAGNTVEELIEEFGRNREATVAAIEGAGDELLRTHVRSAGGVEGTLAEVLTYLGVVHTRGHLDDITGGER